MSLQIWSDNETDRDLLGFRVHADLIRSVVTDQQVLPIVLGVFGDWGGGKSSVMRMLRAELEQPEYEKTVCLYFNGWMFEGYEDAKTALLSSILVELGENKRFGPRVKDKVVSLLKRVKWMEAAKFGLKHVGIPLGAALLTGGTSAVVAAAVAGGAAIAAKAESAGTTAIAEGRVDSDSLIESWASLVDTDPRKPDVLEVRKFHDDFAAMLAATDIQSLVVLIDDLDRCLPERIIETLEAIKLFVAVEKTAFVIGADPRIVRHAIATRYVSKQTSGAEGDEEYDLVKDYLEKLIQIPYHLPRLSPSEIESYINLLACNKSLEEPEYEKVLAHWQSSRKKNLYAAYREAAICEALGSVPTELLSKLAWSNAIADVVTEGLKGNPRQVKRMLNAMALRKKLASIAEIQIKDDVLAKLMVLEYANLSLFQQLNQWQAAENGFPEKLRALEKTVIAGGDKPKEAEGLPAEWLKPEVQNWLRMQPGLSEIDLRDYYWLARDRTNSTLSGVTMVAPIVRRLFESLISENKGEQKLAVKECSDLSGTEIPEIYAMLQRQIERHAEQTPAMDALLQLAEAGLEQAGSTLVTALRNSPRMQIVAGAAYRLKTLSSTSSPSKSDATNLLRDWAKDNKSELGRAALAALK